jgi:hypothetical protein
MTTTTQEITPTPYRDGNWRTKGAIEGGGGVNGSRIKFFSRIGLCPEFKTLGNFYHRRWLMHFPTIEKWSQQNYEASGRRMESIGLTVSKWRSKQPSNVELKKPTETSLPQTRTRPPRPVLDWSENWPGLVRSTQNYAQFLFKTELFLPNLDSWAIRHKMEWNLDSRVTTTQGTRSQTGFSQIQRFPFQFWINSKNLGFREFRRNPPNRSG